MSDLMRETVADDPRQKTGNGSRGLLSHDNGHSQPPDVAGVDEVSGTERYTIT